MIGQTILSEVSMQETKWMEQANCAGTDTEQFFTDDNSKMYDNLPMLKRICSACPVISECKEYSLRYYVLGWWGNTSERMRREERRKLGITAIPIVSDRIYE